MNRTRFALLWLAACLVAGAGIALAAGERYTLVYRFEKGDELRTRLKAEAKGRVEISIEQEARKKTLMVFTSDVTGRRKVIDVAMDGTATIARQIDGMTLKLKAGDKERTVVVADQEARVTINGQMRPLAGGRTFSVENMLLFGRPVIVRKRPTGKVVEGGDDCEAAWRKMLKRVGICGGSDDVPEFAAALSDTTVLPDHPVMVGDTWEHVAKVAVGGDDDEPIEVVTEHVLDKVEKVGGRTVARISYSAAIDLTGVRAIASSLPDMPHMALKRINRRSAGVMILDIDDGRLVRDDSEMEVEFLFVGSWQGHRGEARVIIEGHSRLR